MKLVFVIDPVILSILMTKKKLKIEERLSGNQDDDIKKYLCLLLGQ